jgi:hypothetical protein
MEIMIKHVSYLILSIVLLTNTNTFAMDREIGGDQLYFRFNLDGLFRAWVKEDMDDDLPEQYTTPTSHVLVIENTPNNAVLSDKDELVAVIISKIFIQSPIGMIVDLAKAISPVIQPIVSISIYSINSICNFIQFIYPLYDPDSALEEFYPIKKRA